MDSNSSNRKKNLQNNDETKEEEEVPLSQNIKPTLSNNQSQWLELLQNSFFNFPSMAASNLTFHIIILQK